MSSIGLRLRAARENIRLSQKEVGETLKINHKNISHWENGRALPSLSDLRDLANLYNVTTDYLIGDINAYKQQLTHQEDTDLSNMLFRNDPAMQKVIKSIKFDGTIHDDGAIYRLSDNNIAFIENAIRMAYEEAKRTGQTVVEIKNNERQ